MCEPLKRCSHCRAWKALDAFPRNATRRDGRHNHCKDCKNAYGRVYGREYYWTMRAARRAYDAAYQATHRDAHRARNRAYQARKRAAARAEPVA